MNCQSAKDKEVSIKTYPVIDAAAARARPTLTKEDHLDDQNMLVLSKDSKHDAEGIAQVLWKNPTARIQFREKFCEHLELDRIWKH